MSRVRILDEAAKELDAAAAYVEREREGHGQVPADRSRHHHTECPQSAA